MALSAGRLRDRVSIERENMVSNGRGGRAVPAGEERWIPIATGVPAEILPLRGDEALQQLAVRRVQLWRVTVRRRADLTTGHQLRWRDELGNEIVGNIKSAALNDSRDGIIMTVESGQG